MTTQRAVHAWDARPAVRTARRRGEARRYHLKRHTAISYPHRCGMYTYAVCMPTPWQLLPARPVCPHAWRHLHALWLGAAVSALYMGRAELTAEQKCSTATCVALRTAYSEVYNACGNLNPRSIYVVYNRQPRHLIPRACHLIPDQNAQARAQHVPSLPHTARRRCMTSHPQATPPSKDHASDLG